MSNIGKKIKILRITKDLTQIQLAEMLNVKSYTISDIERGRTEPDINIIQKLCVIFDITSDELLEIETNEQRKKIIINNRNLINNGNITNNGNINF